MRIFRCRQNVETVKWRGGEEVCNDRGSAQLIHDSLMGSIPVHKAVDKREKKRKE